MNSLTEHFFWEDAEITIHRGIDNTIPEDIKPAILNTAKGMERIRSLLGLPITASSWYRCLELNRAIGSHDTSQHPKGEAVDWICPAFGTPAQIVRKLTKYKDYIKFDQLILEHTWIHTSFSAASRGEVLSLLKTGGYAVGITDNMGNPYYG